MSKQISTAFAACILAVALLISACGSVDIAPSTSEGAGGQGPSSTSAGNSTSSSSAGSGIVTLGVPECHDGPVTTIRPGFGELVDGEPVYQDGALALLRATPPVYPWHITSWTYRLARGGFGSVCQPTDHKVVLFVGPASATTPKDAASLVVESNIFAVDLEFVNGRADVTTTYHDPIAVNEGEVIWLGVKLSATENARTCIQACDGGGSDMASFFSTLNAMGTIDACPQDICPVSLLSDAPTIPLGPQTGNDNRRFPFVVTGYAAP